MSFSRLGRWFIMLAALAWSAATPAAEQDIAPTAGRSITSLSHISLKSRHGKRLQLASQIRAGKPTLIAFWASWCPPCVAEASYLVKIRKDLGGSYNFLYINRSDGDPDPNQPAEDVAQFLARTGMSDVDYLVANVSAYKQILGADFSQIPKGLVGLPRVYLFDSNGRQILTSLGFTPAEGQLLEQRVKEAILK